jgi:phosphate transport system protein
MAAALLHAEVGDGAVAHSAGSAPADDLLDEAVHVLAEIGVEMLAGFPKPVTTEIEEAADVIVTLDDHDDIPVVDGKHYQAWRLADPAPDGLDGYRAVRDDLRARVAELAASLVSKTPAPTHTAFDDDLDSLQRRVETTAGLVVGLARRVTSALANPDDVVLDAIIAEDDAIDQADHDTAISAVELIARRQPVAVDLRQILVLAQTSRHLERIADGAVEVAEILRSGRIDRHAPLTRELADMSRAVVTMTETTIDALIRRDVDRARKVAELDGKLDGEQESVFDDLVTARVNGLDRRTLLGLDDIARLLERAGDHAVDIAEETIFLVTGERTELGRPTAAESGYS